MDTFTKLSKFLIFGLNFLQKTTNRDFGKILRFGVLVFLNSYCSSGLGSVQFGHPSLLCIQVGTSYILKKSILNQRNPRISRFWNNHGRKRPQGQSHHQWKADREPVNLQQKARTLPGPWNPYHLYYVIVLEVTWLTFLLLLAWRYFLQSF